MFAKLYEPVEGQQILVKLEAGDDGPEVRFYYEPEGFGVCSHAIGWADTDEGWAEAEKTFSEITEETAVEARDNMIVTIQQFSWDG